MNYLSIKVQVMSGTTIGDAACKAVDLAQRLDIDVCFVFKGIELHAAKHMSPADISNYYIEESERKSKELKPE